MTERQAVAFRFQKASCVALGTFNIYILHPQWLAAHGIIEPGTEVGIETNLNRPGFRLHLPKGNIVWNISPNRVAVETDDPSHDCGDLVAKVLGALPETPVFGLGNNSTYQADLSIVEELASGIQDFPWPEPPSEYKSIAQRTLHVAVKRDEHEVTNVQLALTDDTAELSCNVHTKLEDRPDSNSTAIHAANQFLEDRTRSKNLAQHILGTSLSYDSNNP